MKCQACGHHVQRRDRFCEQCGAPVAPRRKARPQAAPQPQWPLFVALVAAAAVLGAAALYMLHHNGDAGVTQGGFDGTLRGPALAAQYPEVYEVASHFICPCGSCTDGLEVCDCRMINGAEQVRTEIFQLLQEHRPPHVIELIAQRHGHRKEGGSVAPAAPQEQTALPHPEN